MKAKTIVATALFAATNIAAANGGLSINNIGQHMNANDWEATQAIELEINVQGPLDRFQDYVVDAVTVVDVDQFKQNYDGQS